MSELERIARSLATLACAAAFASLLTLQTVGLAATTLTGDAQSLPWFETVPAYIGDTGSGMLAVDDGSQFRSWHTTLGKSYGGVGAAVVTGSGSLWTNSSILYVGLDGNGTLTVQDGGQVTTAGLYAAVSDLHGNGIINATQGAVLDGDLNFNAANGAEAVIAFGTGGTLTVNAALYYSSHLLGAGYRGQGSLTVNDGVSIFSDRGSLGLRYGSNGTARISGAGSTWTVNRGVSVGIEGNGTLRIEAGGKLKSASGGVGGASAAIGAAVISGADSVWETGVFTAGYEGSGTLNVDNGGKLISGEGSLGFFSGASGEAIVAGTGSQWTLKNADFRVGMYGSGNLRVEAGGLVDSYRSIIGLAETGAGQATVTGAGSLWKSTTLLQVGDLGSGTLTVSNGGRVTAGYLYASLADLHGNGTITANGAVLDGDLRFDATHGSLAVAEFGSGGGSLTVGAGTASAHVYGVGYKGNGSLLVSNGVAITSLYGDLGINPAANGSAVITGSGSKWTVSQAINVGVFGNGTMRVEAGGRVTNSRRSYLGKNAGATGEATITGAGSQWTNLGNFTIGYSGNGILKVEAGGRFSCDYGRLADDHGSTGAAIVHGAQSTLTMTGIELGFEGVASLRVEAGGKLKTTSGGIAYTSSSSGDATISGVGSQWANSGNLRVGISGDGTLTIVDGGLVSVGGALQISSQVSNKGLVNLRTGGMLAIRGNADQSLAQFLNLVQGTDALRYWDDAGAGWAPLTNAIFGSDYTLKYLTSGELNGYTLLTVGSVPPATTGDFDFDGDVDGADLLHWQRGGSPDPLSTSDLAAWKANFGVATQTSSYAPVPEPSALVLTAACSVAMQMFGRSLRSASQSAKHECNS